MPGIAGFIDIGETVDTKTQLRYMLEKMKHEEFFVTESYSDPPFGIGRIHLGLENSQRQPIFSKDGKKCIVMIGEVYSYRNLPQNLNEVAFKQNYEPRIILYLFSKYSLQFVNFLNGSFSLAIWDSETKKLIIANDRYGLHPIYYARFNGVFLFASEVKSILALKSFPRILDERSMADFFTFGYILGDKTFLRGITLMPPGCICVVDAREWNVNMERYWDFSFVEDKSIRFEKIADTVNLLLKDSVRRRIPENKRFGLGLSGGVDSRTILAEIEPNLLHQVFAFTVGMKEGFDCRIAKKVCDKLQMEHHFYQLTAENFRDHAEKVVSLTDGMWMFHHSHGAYPIYRELKKHFDIVLVGISGPLFKGVYLSRTILNLSSEKELIDLLFRKTNSLVPYGEQHKFFSHAYGNIVPNSFLDLQEEIAKARGLLMAQKVEYFFLRNRERRFVNLGLVHLGSYFECRTPFLDYDLIDYIQTVPPRFKVNNSVIKQIFMTHYPKLGNIPLGKLGLCNVPLARRLVSRQLEVKIARALSRAWTMFARTLQSRSSARLKFVDPHLITDVDYWFRTELRDFIESILLDDETLARPYFNHKYIAELIRAHMTGKKNLADTLGALVTFELWHRMFLDE